METEYAYPVTVAVYAGENLTQGNLEDAEFTCYKQFYFGSYSEVDEQCDEYFHISLNDCSKLYDIYAVIDPNNDFNEGTLGKQNNIRHIMQIGVDHLIHGNVVAYDWNSMNHDVTMGLNGLPIDLSLTPGGPQSLKTITGYEDGDGVSGYFEFFVPYSYHLEQFSLKAWMDIDGLAEGYDLSGNLCFLKSIDFNEPEDFSIPIQLKPYNSGQDIWFDSMFNITANGTLGISYVNEFMTDRLSANYVLPEIIFDVVNDDTCSFSDNTGEYIIKLRDF